MSDNSEIDRVSCSRQICKSRLPQLSKKQQPSNHHLWDVNLIFSSIFPNVEGINKDKWNWNKVIKVVWIFTRTIYHTGQDL